MRILCNDSMIERTLICVEIDSVYYDANIYDGVEGIMFHCTDGDWCFIRGVSRLNSTRIIIRLFEDGIFDFQRLGVLEFYDED